MALCLSGHEESFVYLLYADVFLHCYHFLELSSLGETEKERDVRRMVRGGGSSVRLERMQTGTEEKTRGRESMSKAKCV